MDSRTTPWTSRRRSKDSVSPRSGRTLDTLPGTRDQVANGQSETFDRFVVGDVAFMQNGNWNIGNAKDQFKFNYGVVEMPTPTGSATSNIFLGGEPGWMGAFSSQPDLAWAFLSQVYSKEGDLASLSVGSIPARIDLATDPQITSE